MNQKSYKELVKPFLRAIDEFNENQFQNGMPIELYEPIQYCMSIGGKRFRPTCLLMSHELFSPNWEDSLTAAFAIELFHNFTLLHDDIMDEAETRRGRQAVHKKYNSNSAILSGDVMMIYCYDYLFKISDQVKSLASCKLLTETAIKVCEGQQMDVNFETRLDVSEDEYIRMISFKTAVLIGAAFKIGALLGGASEDECSALYNFGLNMGIAFQILDDLLDTYGDDSFGKKIGGDIIQAKKTLLYIKARDHATEEDRNHLLRLYGNDGMQEQHEEKVHAIFDRYKVKEKCLVELRAYHMKAQEALKKLKIDTSKLIQLSEVMIRRKV